MMYYQLLFIMSSCSVLIESTTEVNPQFNFSKTTSMIRDKTSIPLETTFSHPTSLPNGTNLSYASVSPGGGNIQAGSNLIWQLLPYWQYQESLKFYKYVSPFLITIGTVGNIVAIVTLQSSIFKSSSTSFILSALALCDIGVLDTGLLYWWLWYAFGIEVRAFSKYGCKIHALLTYYTHHLASWTLILLTLERTISVKLPFKCKQLCSRKRIVIIWIIIAIVLFGLNFHFFFSFDLFSTDKLSGNQSTKVYFCSVYDPWYPFFTGPWYWIDACLGDFIPFGVVITGNILIILEISRSQKKRLNQMNVVAKDDGKTTSTTVTLIMVSVAFLLFSLPVDIYFLGYGYGLFKTRTSNYEDYAISTLVRAITNLLLYANSAIEFILYFVSGQKFRSAFLEMFCCRK